MTRRTGLLIAVMVAVTGFTSVIETAAPHAAHAVAQQLWTCGMHPQVLRDKPGNCPICGMELTPVSVDPSNAAGATTLNIDPAIVQNMGVRTAVVTSGPLNTRVRAVGYIEEPEPNHLDINLRVSGWIEKLYASTDGMHVHAGDPLFDLYSPELQVAIEELIGARRIASGPSGTSVVLDSARRKLRLLGLSAEQLEKFEHLDRAPATVTFYSPVTAHVTEKHVYAGAGVKAGDLILRLADRSTMWLDLQIFEQDLPFMRAGEKVTATVAALPGRTFAGEISFTHPHLDPLTRTAMVRIPLDNKDGELRQGMYASAEVRSETVEQALLMPREAAIDSGLRQVVFIARGEGHFELRPVRLGLAAEDGQVQVTGGLAAGDIVVTSGQFLLDAESRLREAQLKFLQTREVDHDQQNH